MSTAGPKVNEAQALANQKAAVNQAAKDLEAVDKAAGKAAAAAKPQDAPKPSEAQPIIDLAKDLSSGALKDMRAWIDTVLKEREHGEIAAARQKIKEIAESLGIPLAELLGIKTGKTPTQLGIKMPSQVPIKYRNPADASQTWTGRGRAPMWVKDYLEANGGNDAGIKV